MSEHSLEVKHAGLTYFVEIEITETELIDDSFDHEFGTEKSEHTECVEYDVLSAQDVNGDDVDPDFIPGLDEAIYRATNAIDLDA